MGHPFRGNEGSGGYGTAHTSVTDTRAEYGAHTD